jgi:membrane-associated phospholipid phosphatase
VPISSEDQRAAGKNRTDNRRCLGWGYLRPRPFPLIMSTGDSARDWWGQLRRHSHDDRPLKIAGLSVFMGIFFTAYFSLLKSPIFPVKEMPLTVLDQAISFHPWALLLYVSLWVYVSLPPMLIAGRVDLVRYGWAAAAVSAGGMVIFFFHPTRIPPPSIDWSQFPSFSFLRQVDQSGNACPSLHAAFAVFSAIWLDRLLRRAGAPVWPRCANACWCIGILYSTLATKQHVAIDVAAGVALGAVGTAWRPTKN